MANDYAIYETLYAEARAKGWAGWGGDERIGKVGELIPRLLAHPSAPASGKLLELGCGEGSLSRLLAEYGYQVTGIDVSNVAIQWAHEKSVSSEYAIEFMRVDLTYKNLQLSDRYDLVVDGNCLHCILGADRPNFLENVHNCLVDQGIFFISSLCSKGKESLVTKRNGAPYRYAPTVDNLLVELGDAGFTVLNTVVHERAEYEYNHVNIHAQRSAW